MNLFCVECWVKKDDDPHNGHEIDTCFIGDTLTTACEYIDNNMAYAGKPGMDSYKPWFFKIVRRKLNEDEGSVVHNTHEEISVIYPNFEKEEKEEEFTLEMNGKKYRLIEIED